MRSHEHHLINISKYLSKHLRHAPDKIGIQLEAGGWVDVETLLAAIDRHGFKMTYAELAQVVATNNKQRFAFDATGTKIRANQGHSVDIDLELEAVSPPAMLYHGTATRFLASIMRDGLLKMRRHHVHLSADVATAHNVGSRHGTPMILQIDARGMADAGFTFWRSANGVWLVNHVPVAFLQQPDAS